MKPILLLTTFLSLSLTSFAQDPPWLEVGSEWTYQHGVWSGPEYFQVTYGITEITTFAGQECAKMERLSPNALGCINLQPPYYFYMSNDSLYYANESDSTFRLIADFGASVGDSWEYHVLTDIDDPVVVDTFLVTVSGINMLNIEGEDLRQLELDYEWLGSSFYDELWLGLYSGDLTEVIGGFGFFAPFGQLGFCDYETNVTFQCFDSPSISYFNPAYPSCEYIVSVEENNPVELLTIFPNPASSHLWVSIPEQIQGRNCTVQIYNNAGKIIHETNAEYVPELYVPVSHLSSGMYFIKVFSDDFKGYGRFIKTK